AEGEGRRPRGSGARGNPGDLNSPPWECRRHRDVVAAPRAAVLTLPRVLLLCWVPGRPGPLGGPDLKMPTSPPQPWSLADAFETYGVRSWGAGYFGINDKGNVTVHADGNGHAMDLKELVEEVRRRGIGLPLLIRFTDVLRSRVQHLNESF